MAKFKAKASNSRKTRLHSAEIGKMGSMMEIRSTSGRMKASKKARCQTIASMASLRRSLGKEPLKGENGKRISSSKKKKFEVVISS